MFIGMIVRYIWVRYIYVKGENWQTVSNENAIKTYYKAAIMNSDGNFGIHLQDDNITMLWYNVD